VLLTENVYKNNVKWRLSPFCSKVFPFYLLSCHILMQKIFEQKLQAIVVKANAVSQGKPGRLYFCFSCPWRMATAGLSLSQFFIAIRASRWTVSCFSIFFEVLF